MCVAVSKWLMFRMPRCVFDDKFTAVVCEWKIVT